jgi:acyl-CoA thioesterase-1
MNFALKMRFSSGPCSEMIRRALLLALVIVPLFGAAQAATVHERIMVFGDSLSAAYGIEPKQGWVSLLAENLKSRGVEVVNASISGETTRGGLGRIRTDLNRISPTIVVLALGANDGLRGLPVEETKKNLEGIIQACRTAGARVVLVGIQIPPNYGLDYAAQFRDLYPLLAARQKLPFTPFLLEGIADKLELFQADRLHPTAAAQPRIVENVRPAVWQALTQSAATKRR